MADWINPYTFDRYLMLTCTCCSTWWSSTDWNKHSCVLSGSMSTISDKLKYSFKQVAAPRKPIKFDETTALDNNVDTIAHGRQTGVTLCLKGSKMRTFVENYQGVFGEIIEVCLYCLTYRTIILFC